MGLVKGYLLLVIGQYAALVMKLACKVGQSSPLSVLLVRILLPGWLQAPLTKLAIERLRRYPASVQVFRQAWFELMEEWVQNLGDEELQGGVERLQTKGLAWVFERGGFKVLADAQIFGQCIDAGMFSEKEILEFFETQKYLREHRRKHTKI